MSGSRGERTGRHLGVHRGARHHGAVGVMVVGMLLTVTACSGLRATETASAQMLSDRRDRRSGDICEALRPIIDLTDAPMSHTVERVVDEALTEAAALAPPELDEPFGTVLFDRRRDVSDPIDYRALDAAQQAIDVYVVGVCGFSVFNSRVTVDDPTPPMSPSEVDQTPLPPDHLPDRPMMFTVAGNYEIRWTMPRPNALDGPRPLRYIEAPAMGTFWIHGGWEIPVRYDVGIITDVGHMGGTDEEILINTLTQFNGKNPIQFQPAQQLAGRVLVDWMQSFDGRVYLGRSWSFEGNIFSISAAVPAERIDLAKAGSDQLLSVSRTVEFIRR